MSIIYMELGTSSTNSFFYSIVELKNNYGASPNIIITPYSHSNIYVESVYAIDNKWFFKAVSLLPNITFSYRAIKIYKNIDTIEEQDSQQIITQDLLNIITHSGQNIVLQSDIINQQIITQSLRSIITQSGQNIVLQANIVRKQIIGQNFQNITTQAGQSINL